MSLYKMHMYFLMLFLSCQILNAQFGSPQQITNTADGVRWIVVDDIDGDGFKDIVGANRFESNISWYKNNNGTSFSFGQELGFLNQTSVVVTGDFDGDGDLDIAASTIPDNLIVWYENLNGLGDFGNQQIVTNTSLNAFGLIAEDVDADGDIDLLSGGDASRIEWYENTDGLGTFNEIHLVDGSIPNSRSLVMVDLDGDNDLDLVSTSSGTTNLWWYENIDGIGGFSSKLPIGGNSSTANLALVDDIDNDGHNDVLGVYTALDKIVWHKNLDGLGDFGDEMLIDDSVGASRAFMEDFDNDGDVDIVLFSAEIMEVFKLFFLENIDGLGNFSEPILIDDNLPSFLSLVIGADIDNDGDIDIVSASQNSDTIAWYENLTILGTSSLNLTDLKVYPNPSDTILFIEGESTNYIKKMSLRSILGAEVWCSDKYKSPINLESLSAGVYFLTLDFNNEERKLIRVQKK